MTNLIKAPVCEGLRVLELAGDPGGEMAGKLLAQFGADVTKVEPPTGSRTRRIGPFAEDCETPDTSLTFWYYNTSKRSVVLDLPSGLPELETLLARADVVIVSATPAELAELGIDPSALSEQYPDLIICAMTPFGLDGPWAGYGSSDLVSLAAGGLLNCCGYSDHSIPPIRPLENHAFHITASFASISILLALIERQESGRGQIIDLSVHDAVTVTADAPNIYWFYPKALVHRQTCSAAMPMATQPSVFATLDGRYIQLMLRLGNIKAWRNIVAWMDGFGMAADLVEPRYDDLAYRQAQFSHIHGLLEAFFQVQAGATLYHEGQARELPIALVNSPDEVLLDEHLQARQFFELIEHRGVEGALYPGSPVRFSEHPSPRQHAAPLLGSSRSDDIWGQRQENSGI